MAKKMNLVPRSILETFTFGQIDIPVKHIVYLGGVVVDERTINS